MPSDSKSHSVPKVRTLAQFFRGAAWRMEMLHDYPFDLLIWITRGQGRGTLDGQRRGLGMHNLLWVPAGHAIALDLGKQSSGLAMTMPHSEGLGYPPELVHLRVRDVHAQSELTGYLEAMAREDQVARPFHDESSRAYALLLSVWLRRQIISAPAEPRQTAGQRLVSAFSALLARDYASGKTMADYARDLGVTPTHLSRVCRESCDMSAADMLTQRTLHAARDRIESTDLPFQTIAADLGFGSAAYFTRFVQNHTNTSPSALRKRAARL